jgi:hypothetical protein
MAIVDKMEAVIAEASEGKQEPEFPQKGRT